MSNVFSSRVRVLLLVGAALLFSTAQASAGTSGQTVTVKRFTGQLTGTGVIAQPPGAFLSTPTVDYIHFLCDPKLLDWKIRVSHDPFQPTLTLPDANGDYPRICDHIEVLMYYYNPQIAGFDGTAITIQKIP